MLVVMNPVMLAKNRVKLPVLGEYCYATLMLMVYMYVWLQEKKDNFNRITNHFLYLSGMHVHTMSVKSSRYF